MAKAKSKKITLEEALVPVEEQPYEVPENWCWTFLNDVCVFENGYAFKSDKFGKEGIPVIRISNIQENEVDVDNCVYTSETDIEERFIVKKGDLLIAMSGATTGKNGIYTSDRRAYLNQRVGNIKVKSEGVLFPRFRDYFIMSKQEEILNSAYGGAQPNISSIKIGEMLFPLPPLAEQKRIVEQIESLFSKLDEANEKAQEVIDRIETNIEAILYNAFSGKLTQYWRKENSVDYNWKNSTLSKIVSGLKYGSSEKSDYNNNGTPVLRIPNIGEGVIDFSDLKYMQGELENSSHEVFENDILIIRSNGSRDLVGKCAIIPALKRKYAYASFLIRIKASDKVLPKYLVRYINSSMARGQLFAKAKSSSGIHNINSKELGSIRIDVPTIEEQTEILKIIEPLIKKELDVKDITSNMIENIAELKKSILAKAFRGELGTNVLSEENSIELLKKMIGEG